MFEIKKDHEVNRKLQVLTKNGKYSFDNSNRSILTVTWNSQSKKSAIAIGINPSKANDSRSDKTLTTLARFLDAYGYCKFEMLNLFENYSTNQSGINAKAQTDLNQYKNNFKKADSIFIVWGVSSDYKNQKIKALEVLKKFNSKLLCIQNNKGSQPIHPRALVYANKVVPFKL